MKKILLLLSLSGCAFYATSSQTVVISVGGAGARGISAFDIESYETLTIKLQTLKGEIVAEKTIPGGSPEFSLEAKVEPGVFYRATALVLGDPNNGFAAQDFMAGGSIRIVSLNLENGVSSVFPTGGNEFSPDIFDYEGVSYNNSVQVSPMSGALTQLQYRINSGDWVSPDFDIQYNAYYGNWPYLSEGEKYILEVRYLQSNGQTLLYRFNLTYIAG